MRTSHPLAGTLFAVVALGLTACGSSPSTQPPSGPAVIKIASRGGGAAPERSADAAGTSLIAANVTYVVDGQVPDLTEARHAWYYPAGGSGVTGKTVAALAGKLGVEGTPRQAGRGDRSWFVGPEDGSGPTLWVADDAMGSWSYSSGSRPDPACSVSSPAMPAPDAPVSDRDGAGAGTPSDRDAPPPPERMPACEPTTPVGVPDAATAEKLAAGVAARLGLDPDLLVTTYADEWSASVSLSPSFDGAAGPARLQVSFGGDAEVGYMSGHLATPLRGDLYPRIGVEAAMTQFQARADRWQTLAVDPGAALPAEARPEQATDETRPAEVVPPMEEITVVLSDPTDALEQYWAADGTVWLVPAYRFGTGEAGWLQVLAIDEAFIDEEVSVATDDPGRDEPGGQPGAEPGSIEPAKPGEAQGGSTPADPGSAPPADVPGTLPTVESAGVLVGLTYDEAVKVAVDRGWSVRIAAINGEPQALTMDYRQNRVNVNVSSERRVTSVESIG